MARYLGIDGGGSKTTAVVVDEALEVLGRGEAGASNYHSVGEDTAVANILAATTQATAAARVPAQFESAAFCLAGIRRDPDFQRMRPRLEALNLAALVVLDHDAAAAHCAALSGEPGVVVIAGTGSFAYGLNREGERFTSGGWGPSLGDEGSAYWMVMEAVRSALAQYDRGMAQPRLTDVLLDRFGTCDVMSLVDLVYHAGQSRDQIASVATEVARLAEEGDRHAGRILHDAGKHLARLALQVAQKVYPRVDMPVISYQGSVFQAGPILLNAFRMWVRFMRPFARIFPPMHDPVLGAARLALNPSGVTHSTPEPAIDFTAS